MSDDLDKNFQDIFNLPATKPAREAELTKPHIKGNDEIETDYKYARDNMYSIIENGNRALVDLVNIAEQSQHPRAYEVIGQLIKVLGDQNKDLLEIQKKLKVLREEPGDKNSPKNVTNALFVGNTAELQRMLLDKGKVIDID